MDELIFPWPQKVIATVLVLRALVVVFISTRQYADYRYFRKWYRPGMTPPPRMLSWVELGFAGFEIALTSTLLFLGGFFSAH